MQECRVLFGVIVIAPKVPFSTNSRLIPSSFCTADQVVVVLFRSLVFGSEKADFYLFSIFGLQLLDFSCQHRICEARVNCHLRRFGSQNRDFDSVPRLSKSWATAADERLSFVALETAFPVQSAGVWEKSEICVKSC